MCHAKFMEVFMEVSCKFMGIFPISLMKETGKWYIIDISCTFHATFMHLLVHEIAMKIHFSSTYS